MPASLRAGATGAGTSPRSHGLSTARNSACTGGRGWPGNVHPRVVSFREQRAAASCSVYNFRPQRWRFAPSRHEDGSRTAAARQNRGCSPRSRPQGAASCCRFVDLARVGDGSRAGCRAAAISFVPALQVCSISVGRRGRHRARVVAAAIAAKACPPLRFLAPFAPPTWVRPQADVWPPAQMQLRDFAMVNGRQLAKGFFFLARHRHLRELRRKNAHDSTSRSGWFLPATTQQGTERFRLQAAGPGVRGVVELRGRAGHHRRP